MSSVGEKLRRARLDQGLQIDDLATSTKIGARFLEAIESDRRDQIPAGFFFKQWAIQYARALSVDQAEIQDGIDRVLNAEPPLPLPGQAQAASKDLPMANRDSRRRDGTPPMMLSLALLLTVVLGCSGFYAWWHKQQAGPVATVTQRAAAVPSPVAEMAPEEASVSPASERIADPAPAKNAVTAGHPPKRPAVLRKRSRRRMRAKRLTRTSSPGLRSHVGELDSDRSAALALSLKQQ